MGEHAPATYLVAMVTKLLSYHGNHSDTSITLLS